QTGLAADRAHGELGGARFRSEQLEAGLEQLSPTTGEAIGRVDAAVGPRGAVRRHADHLDTRHAVRAISGNARSHIQPTEVTMTVSEPIDHVGRAITIQSWLVGGDRPDGWP